MSVPVPTYPDLSGRCAFVTGGSKGIGRATCRVLAANGVNVAVVARDSDAVEQTASELRSFGTESIGITADCTSFAEIEKARQETERRFGPVDILLPFAGGFGARTPTIDITAEEVPILDGSASSFVFLLQSAGIELQKALKRFLRVKKAVEVREGEEIGRAHV